MVYVLGKEVDYNYVTSPRELEEFLLNLKPESIVALDTESYPDVSLGERASALDPHTSLVRLIQIGWAGLEAPYIIDVLAFQKSHLMGCDEMISFVEWLVDESVEKIAHYAQYELKVLYKLFGSWVGGIRCSRVAMQNIGCATGKKSADMRGNSLLSLCRDYLGVNIDKYEQMSDWSREPLLQSQLEYAAIDVGAPKGCGYSCLIVEGYNLIREALVSPIPSGYDMEFVADLDQQVMKICAQMEYRGNVVNLDVMDAAYKSIQSELEPLKVKLCNSLGLPVDPSVEFVNGRPTKVYKISPDTSKLLNSPKALVSKVNAVLKNTNQALSNMQADSLVKLLASLQREDSEEIVEEEDKDCEIEYEAELIADLIRYKTLVKMNGVDYRKMLNPVTERLHGGFNTIGASTGRMSSSTRIKTDDGEARLNLQQLGNIPISINIEPEKLFLNYKEVGDESKA